MSKVIVANGSTPHQTNSMSVAEIGFVDILDMATRHWRLLVGGVICGWGVAAA
jgi:hypothetical protein